MPLLIHHFLEESAARFPENTAVIKGNKRWTYRQVETLANRFANWLSSMGITKGDRIGFLLRNTIEYIYIYYGILKIGGIAVPLNTAITGSDLIKMLIDCSASVFVFDERLSRKPGMAIFDEVEQLKYLVLTGRPSGLCSFGKKPYLLKNIIDCSSDIRPTFDIDPCQASSIIYTSGTTGKAKGAVLSHKGIVSNTESIVLYLGLTEHDRSIVVLPLFYVYGKSVLNSHFAVGGSVILEDGFAFPNAVLENMIKGKATNFSGVPTTYNLLLKKSSVREMKFPDLRFLTQAGGHLASEVKGELMKVFNEQRIYVMYGATEASARLAYLPADGLRNRISSIGKPIPGVEMKIVKKDGTEAGPGENGEIIARGPNIMLGYWNDTIESAKVLVKGWYHTGDLGYVDEEGFFYVTGRERDIIKTGLHKVSSIEIEEIFYKCPAVLGAAVVGVPDEILGEKIVAVIVPDRPGAISIRELRDLCAASLPSYKIPGRFVITDALPVNEAGKILKRKLVEDLTNFADTGSQMHL